MKVYVVTSGSYSDYSINRVFLDKEKAEKYVDMCEDSEIEEYETDDDKEINEIKYVRIYYGVEPNQLPKYQFHLIKTNTLDKSEENIKHTSYFCYSSNRESLSICRIIKQLNYNEEDLKNKYEKVCQDLYAQIKYQKSQGWDRDMINKWLKTIK